MVRATRANSACWLCSACGAEIVAGVAATSGAALRALGAMQTAIAAGTPRARALAERRSGHARRNARACVARRRRGRRALAVPRATAAAARRRPRARCGSRAPSSIAARRRTAAPREAAARRRRRRHALRVLTAVTRAREASKAKKVSAGTKLFPASAERRRGAGGAVARLATSSSRVPACADLSSGARSSARRRAHLDRFFADLVALLLRDAFGARPGRAAADAARARALRCRTAQEPPVAQRQADRDDVYGSICSSAVAAPCRNGGTRADRRRSGGGRAETVDGGRSRARPDRAPRGGVWRGRPRSWRRREAAGRAGDVGLGVTAPREACGALGKVPPRRSAVAPNKFWELSQEKGGARLNLPRRIPRPRASSAPRDPGGRRPRRRARTRRGERKRRARRRRDAEKEPLLEDQECAPAKGKAQREALSRADQGSKRTSSRDERRGSGDQAERPAFLRQTEAVEKARAAPPAAAAASAASLIPPRRRAAAAKRLTSP